LSELDNQTLAFACAGQVAHAFVRVGGREIALEEEVDSV
jgi:hypothetical protein